MRKQAFPVSTRGGRSD